MTGPVEVLVVGGGLAGAAAAALLADAGRSVVLVERREHAHHKVCGEFLSHEAQTYLASLGLDLAGLGAVPIEGVRLVDREILSEARLPFPALSLSRRVLDEALLGRALAAGVEVRRGRSVQGLTHSGGSWQARLDDGRKLDAATAFIATGKHELRGWRRPPGLQNDLIAFKLHWRLAPAQAAALGRHVELILFEGGYAGLEPIEDGLANLCLLVRRRRFEALGSRWDALLETLRRNSPHLDRRLANATPAWERPLAIGGIPYGHLRWRTDGPWRLGDQAAVIPSFSGDGMSIALHSARLAATRYLGGGTAAGFQARLARDVAVPVHLATLLSHLLVRGSGQRALGAMARHVPGLLGAVAGRTRVPEAALFRAQAA